MAPTDFLPTISNSLQNLQGGNYNISAYSVNNFSCGGGTTITLPDAGGFEPVLAVDEIDCNTGFKCSAHSGGNNARRTIQLEQRSHQPGTPRPHRRLLFHHSNRLCFLQQVFQFLPVFPGRFTAIQQLFCPGKRSVDQRPGCFRLYWYTRHSLPTDSYPAFRRVEFYRQQWQFQCRFAHRNL